MEILLGILIEWLVLNANLEIKYPPDVIVMEQGELAKKYGAPVHALYSHTDSTIYLSNHVDLSTIQGSSVLLHELVHHYQNVSGAMDGYNCMQESEKLAYTIQRDYLEKNNAKIMPELNQFNIVMRSLCESY